MSAWQSESHGVGVHLNTLFPVLHWLRYLIELPSWPAAAIFFQEVAPDPQHLHQRKALHCATFILSSRDTGVIIITHIYALVDNKQHPESQFCFLIDLNLGALCLKQELKEDSMWFGYVCKIIKSWIQLARRVYLGYSRQITIHL